MITVIQGMPEGTIGLEASGTITDEDYRTVLEPALSAALERGEVRLMYVIGEGSEFSRGAMWEDSKVWAKNVRAWKRIAVVTDADWLEHTIKAFSWLIPGQMKVFELDDTDDAKQWLAADDDDD